MIKKGLFILSVIFLSLIILACQNNEEIDVPIENTIEHRIDQVFEEIKLPESTMSDLTLKKVSLKEPKAQINWISDNQVIITNQGEVRRKEVDHEVELTAIVSLEGKILSRVFKVVVRSVDSFQLPIEAYKSDYGYASMVISNRMNQTNIAQVHNEVEFLDALKDKSIKVINIKNDLNMGYLNVVSKLEQAGKTRTEIESYTNGSYYRMNQNVPTLHPTLLTSGVGQMILQDRDGLMIYSETGITINHLTTQIKTSKDIVIRNIKFTGIWEWDDDFAANYDELDWDYFTIETTDGIWLDHLSFDQAYDGLVDVKGGTSNITLSYLWLDFQINDFLMEQFDYMEEEFIQNKKRSKDISRYVRLREEFGLTKEQIAGYSAMQKKGFNLGNTTMGAGFDGITVTIHHSYIRNLADRLPRLRQGDVHMYNVVLDHTDIQYYRNVLSGTGTTLVSQALVPTENGSVLAENNYFINVLEPIKTHQDSILDPLYTGRFKIVNSILVNGIDFYQGGSYEGEANQDRFTPWKQTNTNMPRIPFFMRNYQEIPYKYNSGNYNYFIETQNLVKALKDESNHVGPGVIEGLNWLEIRKLYTDPLPATAIRGYKIDEKSIHITDALIEMNSEFTPLNPLVKNFYKGGPNFIRNTDYTLEVDMSNLDLTTEGEYDVIYKFKNLHPGQEKDIVTIIQSVYVYDAEKANEIYANQVSNEFNSTININYNVYTNSGTLYYALSNIDNLTLDEVKYLENLQSVSITDTKGTILNIPTNRVKYLYMYTDRDGLESQLVKTKIISEEIINVSTPEQFNAMVTSYNTKGKYYVLTNAIDFNGGAALNQLSTMNVFSGVFDGNGYTLKNVNKTVLRAGLFMTINGGMIKNVTLENIKFNVDSIWTESSETPGLMVEQKASDDAGVLATYVYGSAYFEDIKIKDAKVTTTRNYAATLLGRVRTGFAHFNRITVENSEVHAVVTSAKYSGGLIGGAETNTKVLMNDVYVNGLTLTHTQSDMFGVIIGRVRSHFELTNAVVHNVVLNGRHNLGLVVGKEDNTTTLISITNFFGEAEFNFQPDASGIYSEYYGYVAGNSDAGKITTSRFYAVAIENFGRSKGNNSYTELIESIEVADELWWQTKLSPMYESPYWEYNEGVLKLK